MAEAEAQAKLPEKPRPARLKTSHDSFSSMPATSPRERRRRAGGEGESGAGTAPRAGRLEGAEVRELRVALSRAAEIAKDAPFAKRPSDVPADDAARRRRCGSSGASAADSSGCCAVGRETRADRADRAQEETGAEDAQAGARRRGAGEDGDGDGGADAPRRPTDVASPRILKEVFLLDAHHAAMGRDTMRCVCDDDDVLLCACS